MNIAKTKIVKVFSATSILIYLIYILGSQFGYIENYWIFFGKDDRFGDIYKLIYSFSSIFSNQDFLDLNVPNNLIGPEKNPYAITLSNGAIASMGHPPLTIILIVTTANFAKIIGFHYSIIYIIYLAFLGTCLLKIYSSNLQENFLLIFILLSFPLLYLIERGNIWAAISGVCLLMLFRSFVYNQELSSLDLIYFILACSIRPNYLIFGLLFLTDKTLKSVVFKFLKVGAYFIAFNSFFLLIAMRLYPGYDLGYFIYLVDRYSYSEIRFTSWNSSVHSFIYNIYSAYLNSNNVGLTENFIIRIEELLFGQAVSNLIVLVYILILLVSFSQLRLKNMNKISFLSTVCCITALSTSPFADYHLIIFIFLFFLIYDLYKNNYKYLIQLTMISIILLPKFHAIPPDFNINNIVNVLCLNVLLFVSFINNKTNHLQ
jgi:hypothetical protein